MLSACGLYNIIKHIVKTNGNIRGNIVVGTVEDYVQKEIINLGSGDYSGVILTTMIYAFVAVFFTSKFFLSNYIMILRNTEYSMVRKSILHSHSK